MKFPHDPEDQEKIRTTKACHDIKRLGGTRQIKLRPDWEEVKENIMMIALGAKFDQYPELKQLLLSTAGNSLVEHTENDNYWGDAGDGSGLNRLGDLLVELREYYLNNDKTTYMIKYLQVAIVAIHKWLHAIDFAARTS